MRAIKINVVKHIKYLIRIMENKYPTWMKLRTRELLLRVIKIKRA